MNDQSWYHFVVTGETKISIQAGSKSAAVRKLRAESKRGLTYDRAEAYCLGTGDVHYVTDWEPVQSRKNYDL